MCAAFDGTYLPGEDRVQIADVERFLEQQGDSGFFLVGAAGRVPVPPELAALIREAVDIFRYDQAVSVASLPLLLTVGQAAPILRAREEQVEEMLDEGALPSVQTDHGRRIPLRELLAHEKRRREDFYDWVAEDWDSDGGAVPTDDDQESMRQVRREVAEESRQRRAEGQD